MNDTTSTEFRDLKSTFDYKEPAGIETSFVESHDEINWKFLSIPLAGKGGHTKGPLGGSEGNKMREEARGRKKNLDPSKNARRG